MIDTWNEADVREEIIQPFLTRLGYKKGTTNDILREEQISLEYPYIFLGRKKPGKDPVIRGKPDYVLHILTVGRWVLEVKAPSESLDRDVIEQAISYARHPEVLAYYVVVTNGKEFLIYNYMNRAHDEPVIPLIVDKNGLDPEILSERVKGILSPAALRRDLSFPVADVGTPLGQGLRSKEDIKGGIIRYTDAKSQIINCPPLAQEHFETRLTDMESMFQGYQSAINGGRLWRDAGGRILAHLTWSTPHVLISEFVESKNLFEVDYISLSETLSNDENIPTTFDVVGEISVSEGETLYDLREWQTVTSERPVDISYRGQALGHLKNRTFIGIFQAEYFTESRIMGFPLSFVIQVAGSFEVQIR